MLDWISGICDEVDRRTAQQAYYQELFAQWTVLKPRYEEILRSLSEADADVIEEFYYLTTEMDYQRMQTAYRIGCLQQQSRIG